MNDQTNNSNFFRFFFKAKLWQKMVMIFFYLAPFLFAVVIAIIQMDTVDKKISNYQKNENNTNVSIGEGSNQKKDEDISISERKEEVQGIQNWIEDGNAPIDNEDYYCPAKKGFEYWGIWTNNKIGANYKMLLRLKLKDKTNPLGTLPRLSISYGEYKKGLAPIIDYSLKFFEGDSLRSAIRLYNSSNKSMGQEYLDSLPGLNQDIIIKIESKVINENTNYVYLIPSVTYLPQGSDKQSTFISSHEFKTLIASPDIQDETFTRQIGIGINPGGCFKILSFEMQ